MTTGEPSKMHGKKDELLGAVKDKMGLRGGEQQKHRGEAEIDAAAVHKPGMAHGSDHMYGLGGHTTTQQQPATTYVSHDTRELHHGNHHGGIHDAHHATGTGVGAGTHTGHHGTTHTGHHGTTHTGHDDTHKKGGLMESLTGHHKDRNAEQVVQTTTTTTHHHH